MQNLHIVILAAGQGKRMYSTLPKVLHPIGDKAMISHVIKTAHALKPERIHVVVGHGADEVITHLKDEDITFVKQDQQLGTGHAVLQALPAIEDHARVLILSGDVPLIRAQTLEAMLADPAPMLTLLVANVPDPHGLGRILRHHDGSVLAIVEEKDATPAQKQINEIYSGICVCDSHALKKWLPKLQQNNAQGEYYLTEIVDFALQEGALVATIETTYLPEIQGVNNQLQRQTLEREYQKQLAHDLMMAGVHLNDAARIDIRGSLQTEHDVMIDVNCLFIGNVRLGANVRIGPNCILKDVTVGAHSEILANSILENTILDEHCQVGPFARIRPGTHLEDGAKVGNFVEVKNTTIGPHSKASHLSYLGDTTIGRDVNIGAGTITCNYDGANKHHTYIEDGAFIGSDTQLVAPVRVGRNATVGAGSTIRKDVPAEDLTLTEATNKTIKGWKRPQKKQE